MENVLKVLQSYGKPMLRQCSYYTAEEFHNGFTLKTQEIFFVHTTLEEFENKGLTLKTHQMFCVHTTLEEFENGGFTLKTHQMFSVHTTPEEFENGGFTLKTHQMFSVHTTPKEFENRGFALKTHQMFFVHTTPEEFENKCVTLKTHQMFSVHTTPEEFKNTTITGHFGFVFDENLGKEITWLSLCQRFQNAPLSNCFPSKSVFEKLRFRDGSLWTVDLTVELKLRSQIYPVQCGRGLRSRLPVHTSYSPSSRLRTDFFPLRFLAQARSARARNRRGKKEDP